MLIGIYVCLSHNFRLNGIFNQFAFNVAFNIIILSINRLTNASDNTFISEY